MLRARASFHPMLMLALVMVARAEQVLVREGSQERLRALRERRAHLLRDLTAGRLDWDRCVLELRVIAARSTPSVRAEAFAA